MNKVDLVEEVAIIAKLTKKEASEVVDAVFDSIENALLAGEEVKISNFGTFSVKKRVERQGVNPSNGEPITIPSARVLSYKPSKILKEKIN